MKIQTLFVVLVLLVISTTNATRLLFEVPAEANPEISRGSTISGNGFGGSQLSSPRMLSLVEWARELGMPELRKIGLAYSARTLDWSRPPFNASIYRPYQNEHGMLPNHLIIAHLAEEQARRMNMTVDVLMFEAGDSRYDLRWAKDITTKILDMDILILGRLFFEIMPDATLDNHMKMRGLMLDAQQDGVMIHPDLHFEDFVVDKALMLNQLQRAGLPIIPTLFYSCREFSDPLTGHIRKSVIDEIRLKLSVQDGDWFVVKPGIGSMANGVEFVKGFSWPEREKLRKHVEGMCDADGWAGMLVQKFHSEAFEATEIRVYYVDGVPAHVCGTTHTENDAIFWGGKPDEWNWVAGPLRPQLDQIRDVSRHVIATLAKQSRQYNLPWLIRVDYLLTADGYRISEVEFPPFMMPNCVDIELQGDTHITASNALIAKAQEIWAMQFLDSRLQRLDSVTTQHMTRQQLAESVRLARNPPRDVTSSGIPYSIYKECMRSLIGQGEFDSVRALRDGLWTVHDFHQWC